MGDGIGIASIPSAAALAQPPAAPPSLVLPLVESTSERRDRRSKVLLVACDALAVAVSLGAGVALFGAAHLRVEALLALPLVVVLAKLQGLYDRDELVLNKATLDELPKLLQLVTAFVMVLWLLDAGIIGPASPREQLLSTGALLLGALAVLRTAGRRLAARTSPVERCLVVGDDEVFRRMGAKLGARRGVELVGWVAIEDVLGDVAALEAIAIARRADRVIMAPTFVGAGPATLELVRAVKATGLRVSILPGILEVVGTSVVFDDVDGMTLLGVRRFGLTRSSLLVKRGFDVVGSALLLLAMAPLLALLAIAIRLDSPGRALYRQVRVGREGERFVIFKFRTMRAGSADARREILDESGCFFKLTEDPRITRVGAFLRRTSLDEMPQLINVLRGQMSLVGPRPLVEVEDDLILGLDRRRLDLTPGMTGHWQVLGSSRVPLAEMVKIDYLYVAGWTLWADVKILLRTARMVATGANR